jgi:hypothetical protein
MVSWYMSVNSAALEPLRQGCPVASDDKNPAPA